MAMIDPGASGNRQTGRQETSKIVVGQFGEAFPQGLKPTPVTRNLCTG
jgi:hypothetical protein